MKSIAVRLMIVCLILSGFWYLSYLLKPKETAASQELVYDASAAAEGIKCYESNEDDMAVSLLTKALSGTFSQAELGKVAVADEKELRALFDSDSDAAAARYALAIKYTEQRKTKEAAQLLRDTLEIVSTGGAKYVGTDKCKKCHIKEYLSWKKTKMAKTLEVLKPGQSVEAKKASGLSTEEDYSKDTSCLPCHTTGFDMPGGYALDKGPERMDGDLAGAGCESCHGPGSRYIELHAEIAKSKRNYTAQEHYDAGGFEINAGACMTCHNRRNPTAGADFVFDFEKYKGEGIHENVPLKYRTK